MRNRIVWLIPMFLSLALAVWAADVTGKWTAQVPGRNGNMRDVTFDLKSSGDSLTGTMSARNGDVPISDGKISGDSISFTVTLEFGGNTVKQMFAGKVAGSEIHFKREGGQGQPIEFTAKKQ